MRRPLWTNHNHDFRLKAPHWLALCWLLLAQCDIAASKPQWPHAGNDFYSSQYQSQAGYAPQSAFGSSNYGGFNRPFVTRAPVTNFQPYSNGFGAAVGGGAAAAAHDVHDATGARPSSSAAPEPSAATAPAAPSAAGGGRAPNHANGMPGGMGASVDSMGPGLSGMNNMNSMGAAMTGLGPSMNGMSGMGASMNNMGPSMSGMGASMNGMGASMNNMGPNMNSMGPNMNSMGPNMNGMSNLGAGMNNMNGMGASMSGMPLGMGGMSGMAPPGLGSGFAGAYGMGSGLAMGGMGGQLGLLPDLTGQPGGLGALMAQNYGSMAPDLPAQPGMDMPMGAYMNNMGGGMGGGGGYGASLGSAPQQMTQPAAMWPQSAPYGQGASMYSPSAYGGFMGGGVGGYDMQGAGGMGSSLGGAAGAGGAGGGEDYNSGEDSAELAAGDDLEQAHLRRYAEYLEMVNRRYGIGMPGQLPLPRAPWTAPAEPADAGAQVKSGSISSGGAATATSTDPLNPTAPGTGSLMASRAGPGYGAGFGPGGGGYPAGLFEGPYGATGWPGGPGGGLGATMPGWPDYAPDYGMGLSPLPYGYNNAIRYPYPANGAGLAVAATQQPVRGTYRTVDATTPAEESRSKEKSSLDSASQERNHGTPSTPTATSIQALTQQIRRLPAVLYVDSKDTDGRRIENLLRDTYGLPLISFYVDKIDKPKVVEKYLHQLTAHKGMPYLFICGTFIGSHEHIDNYHKNKQIPQLVEYVCGEEKDKKSHHKDKETKSKPKSKDKSRRKKEA